MKIIPALLLLATLALSSAARAAPASQATAVAPTAAPPAVGSATARPTTPAPGRASGDTLILGVDDAVRLALRQGEPAAMAREDIRIAEAQKGVALSHALPNVSLSATYNRNLKVPVIFFPDEQGVMHSIQIGEDNEYRGILAVRQPLFSSGRLGAGYKAARTRAEAARSAGDAAAAGIALQVKTTYYGALLAEANTIIAARSLEQAARREKEIEAKVDKGVAPRFDLLRARTETANRRPFLTRARNQAATALEALKRTAGLPLDRPVVLADSLRYRPLSLTREQAVEEALANRPDLAAARRQVEAARYQLKAVAANDLPLLYLEGNYVWQGQSSDRFFPQEGQTAQSAAVGLSFTWPILDGFENRNRTRQAKAGAEKARLAVEQLEESIRLQVRSAWADVRSLEEELDGVNETVRLAEEAYKIAEVRFRSGLSTQLEVLDADLALTRARLARTETLYRYEVAVASLETSLGRGPSLDAAGGDR